MASEALDPIPSLPLSKSSANQCKQPSWAERVAGSSLPTSRMKLSYFQPSMEGSNIVVSPPPEVEEMGMKKWDLCLVGYFLDAKLPAAVVISITMKLWARQGVMEVSPHGKGFYIFRFS